MNIIMPVLIILSVGFVIINSKTSNFATIIEHFSVLYNDNKKTKKIYWLDIVTFFISPILISLIIVLYYKLYLDNTILQVFITVFSLISALLFTFITSLVEKNNLYKDMKDRNEEQEKFFLLIRETLLLIMYTIVIGILDTLSLIILYFTSTHILSIILNVLCIFLSLQIFIYIFSIIKRFYKLVIQ